MLVKTALASTNNICFDKTRAPLSGCHRSAVCVRMKKICQQMEKLWPILCSMITDQCQGLLKVEVTVAYISGKMLSLGRLCISMNKICKEMNYKVFVVRRRRRRHPGDDNTSTFLRTAELKREDVYPCKPNLSPYKIGFPLCWYCDVYFLWRPNCNELINTYIAVVLCKKSILCHHIGSKYRFYVFVYSKFPILRPPLELSKSGLKDHFWTVPKVVSDQIYTGCRKWIKE